MRHGQVTVTGGTATRRATPPMRGAKNDGVHAGELVQPPRPQVLPLRVRAEHPGARPGASATVMFHRCNQRAADDRARAASAPEGGRRLLVGSIQQGATHRARPLPREPGPDLRQLVVQQQVLRQETRRAPIPENPEAKCYAQAMLKQEQLLAQFEDWTPEVIEQRQ